MSKRHARFVKHDLVMALLMFARAISGVQRLNPNPNRAALHLPLLINCFMTPLTILAGMARCRCCCRSLPGEVVFALSGYYFSPRRRHAARMK